MTELQEMHQEFEVTKRAASVHVSLWFPLTVLLARRACPLPVSLSALGFISDTQETQLLHFPTSSGESHEEEASCKCLSLSKTELETSVGFGCEKHRLY